MSQVTVWFFLLYIFFPWLETISGKVGLWSPQSCPKPILFWFASRGLLGTRPPGRKRWCWITCGTWRPAGQPSLAPPPPSSLEPRRAGRHSLPVWRRWTRRRSLVLAESLGWRWHPGWTGSPWCRQGPPSCQSLGRVSQGRVSVRIKEHLQKAGNRNIITFTCKGNSIIVYWRTQWWKSAPYDVTEGTNISVRLVRTLPWKVCCSYIIP